MKAILEALFKAPSPVVPDLLTAPRASKPNNFRIRAFGRQNVAAAEPVAPLFNRSPAGLASDVDAALPSMTGDWTLHERSADGLTRHYVVRTPLMRYPDLVSIEISPASDGPETGASISVFSRSVYGHSDLGANKARVDQLLTALQN